MEINFDVKKSAVGSYFTYAIVNKERTRVCILASGIENIKGYVLDQDSLLHEFTMDKATTASILVGGYFDGEKINFLLGEKEDDNSLTHYTYDPITGKAGHVDTKLDMKKAFFIGAMSQGDQLLYVSVKKKENKIIVYRFGKENSGKPLEFNYAPQDHTELSLFETFTEVTGFSRTTDIACINDWEAPGLEKAKNGSKLYFRNDSVFITIERSPELTRILGLDLTRKTISVREVKRQFDMHSIPIIQQTVFYWATNCTRWQAAPMPYN